MRVRVQHIVLFALTFWLGACAIPQEAPTGTQGTVHEYFWPGGNKQLQYRVYRGLNSTPEVHNVTLTSRGDTIDAVDVFNGRTGLIRSRTASNSIILNEIQSTALFPLPEGAYVAKGANESVERPLPVSNFIIGSTWRTAFTLDGIYQSPDRQNWDHVDSLFDETVTVTATHPEGRLLYAGTLDGDIYLSEDKGREWVKALELQGPIRSIVFGTENIVYIAVDGAGIFGIKSGQQFGGGMDLPTKNITGLAVTPSPFGDLLYVSTRDKGLLKRPASSGGPWSKANSGFTETNVLGIFAHHVNMVALFRDGYIAISEDTGKSWTLKNVGIRGQFSVGEVSQFGIALGSSEGDVFRADLDGGELQLTGTIGAHINAMKMEDGGVINTASEKGWIRVRHNAPLEEAGPTKHERDTSRGEFILLKANDLFMQVGDRWDAGTLYLPQSPITYIPITAQVVEHLDSLRVDDQVFSDVYAVKYFFEHQGTQVNAEHWILYFSRFLGPVMIDRIPSIDSVYNPSSRAIYIRKP